MFIFIRLHGDALVKHQAARSVDAAPQDDRIAGYDAFYRRLEACGMVQLGSDGIAFSVRRNVVHRLRFRYFISLVDRPIGST